MQPRVKHRRRGGILQHPHKYLEGDAGTGGFLLWMKLSHLFRIAAFKAACALLFAQGVNAEPLANAPGFVHDTVQVPAPSLGDNLFEESDTQTLHVYLPPSYESDQDARFRCSTSSPDTGWARTSTTSATRCRRS
jgi:hypothetical protein